MNPDLKEFLGWSVVAGTFGLAYLAGPGVAIAAIVLMTVALAFSEN